MRRLVEQHKRTLSSFLEQRHDLALIAHASDADAVIVLQLASELDQASDEDLFVLLGGEFHDADSYALAAAELFARQHELAAVAVTEAGKAPLPSLPPALLAPGRPGRERLCELVAFAHRLLPREARRLVVVVAPTAIDDRVAFLALMAHLLPRPRREPWMARLRLILRDVASDDSSAEATHPLAQTTPAGVSVTRIDFGPDAIHASLEATAEDGTATQPERMQALLAAAMLDGVYERSASALAKLERVLAHYQTEKNPLMQAVTVNAMGEVCQRAGDFERAQHWFECALPLAVESESALVLATVAKNLGSLCALRGDHASAVQYFDGLAQIAPKMLDNETLSWALEQRGLSEAALGQNQRAIETWRVGADLCRNTDHLPGLSGHLGHLRDAHGEAGHIDEQRQAERELDRIGEALEHA
jgi:tetratricopeptide (TPR) repeat protein